MRGLCGIVSEIELEYDLDYSKKGEGIITDDFSKQMEMVLYNSEGGDVSVNAYIKDETLWITLKRW